MNVENLIQIVLGHPVVCLRYILINTETGGFLSVKNFLFLSLLHIKLKKTKQNCEDTKAMLVSMLGQ